MTSRTTLGLAAALAAALVFAAPQRGAAQHLAYQGGRVLHHPRVHVVYWSGNWNADNPPEFSRANIEAWLHSFLSSNYFDTAGQYDAHSGSFEDAHESLFGGPGSTTNSLFIHLWLTGEIELPGTGVPYPCDDDDLYVVLLPSGTQIDNGFNRTCDSFGAYHLFAPILVPPVVCGLFDPGGIQTAAYVVIPVSCATKAAGANGFYNNFDALTMLLSHEIIEASTDPICSFITSIPVIGDIFSFLNPGGSPGWFDDSLPIGDLFTKSEAADICEFAPFFPEVWHNNSLVAAYWSNQDNAAATGPGVVKMLTLRQSGVPSGTPVPVQFDSRTPDVNAGGGFSIQVATNTTHSYAYPTPVNGAAGTRYVTTEPPASPTILDNFTKTALYTAEYFVTVATNPAAAAVGNASLTPSAWYPAGSFQLQADQYVSAGTGTRYSFASWSGGVSTGDRTPTLTLSGPLSVTANYDLQDLVQFDQTGIPGGPTWHVTVGGTEHVGPYSEWFARGGTVDYAYETPVMDTTPGTRYVLTGSAPATGFTVGGPTSVLGTYKTQHLLTVSTNGLGTNNTNVYNGASVLGTANDASPYSDWFDHGTALALTVDALVDGAGGVEYFFQSFSTAPPSVLNAPFSTTAAYLTMDQLIEQALAGGGISGPGANGIANALHHKWAAITADLAAGHYNAALGALKAFVQFLSAQSGKQIDAATAKTLALDALMVYQHTVCKAQAAGQIDAATASSDYAWYSAQVTALGGTPLPPCP